MLLLPVCVTSREIEIKQLQGWKGTVENLVDKFVEVLQSTGLGHTLGAHAHPQPRSSTAAQLAAAAAAGSLGRSSSSASSAAGAAQGAGESADAPAFSPRSDSTTVEADRLANGGQERLQAAVASGREGGADADGAQERMDAGVGGASGAGGGGGSRPEVVACDGAGDPDAAGGGAEDGDAAMQGTARVLAPSAGAGATVPEPPEPELELVPTPQQSMQLAKLRTHFHKDVRKQLYGDAEDKMFFEWLKTVSGDGGLGKGHTQGLLLLGANAGAYRGHALLICACHWAWVPAYPTAQWARLMTQPNAPLFGP